MPRRIRDIGTLTDPGYLRDLFNNSAWYYDRVNRVTSLGQVKLWRREVIAAARLRPDDQVLDAFCGPGGLAEKALPHLGPGGRLVLADLSPVMMQQAKRRLEARLARSGSGHAPRVDYVQGDLLRDELGLAGFDVVLVGWALRYVADVPGVLARMRSFLKPGGRLVVLEFTRPPACSWATPVHLYFRRILPRIGSWLAADRELHDYLSWSSAEFLPVAGLVRQVERAGFAVDSCRSHFDGLVTVLSATLPIAAASSSGR